MNQGPSKAELENYWKNSRAYFDEIARYYQTADPEYYRKYIAPFYSNPFASSSVSGSGSRPLPLIILSVAILLIGILAAGVFFLLQFDNDKTLHQDKPEIEKKIEKEEEFIGKDSLQKDKEINPDKLYYRKQPYKRVR